MSRRLQLLIVEDNPNDAELVVDELERSGFELDWRRVDTEADYLAELKPSLHLILSDFDMPQFNGLRALELLKRQPALEIPFIIVSGTIGEETAVATMQNGASDYLLKDRIGRLGSAVRRVLEQAEQRVERKRLEAQFIEAQKMEVVGHLAGGVAHDFNNVLAVIMGYGDLIAQDLGPAHPLQKYAEEIRHAAKRGAGLTQQLLIFSRKKQTVQPMVLDLNEVVEGMANMLRRLVDENVEMIVNCGKLIGGIRADSGYVWQVLLNLVVNARDAMPQGGKLIIETSPVTLDEAYVRAHPAARAGEYAMICVSDTGSGMSNEVKAHLFEAFFTTKPAGKGTGLGLVTCQTIVRQCGGHIEVVSELERGTTFKVYFPQIDQPVSVAIHAARPKTGPLRSGIETLLVVEDDPAVRHLAQGVLQSKGYNVLTAPNGHDALRVAREHKHAPLRLVITDIVMPRMGGTAMAERLKTIYPHLKILFTSGYTEDAIAENSALGSGVEFLPKPYSPATLLKKVRELLDS
jgi:two-component system cell cycle sensor histidine kinase/response regulator CckA